MKEVIFTHNLEEYVFLVGENKYDNFNLIDISETTDIWFHVEKEPSCHVILKNSNKLNDIPRQVITRGAYLCKIHSKSRTKKTETIMYTPLKNVTKTDTIGQVIVTVYWTVDV
jgi:predicted ribosome quality control (RQC) complex YloA/Tae2 family protein